MDADETDICNYLGNWPGQYLSLNELSRRAAGKRRYEKDRDWAVRALWRLVQQGKVEDNGFGQYRLREIPKDELEPKNRDSQPPQRRKNQSRNAGSRLISAESSKKAEKNSTTSRKTPAEGRNTDFRFWA